MSETHPANIVSDKFRHSTRDLCHDGFAKLRDSVVPHVVIFQSPILLHRCWLPT